MVIIYIPGIEGKKRDIFAQKIPKRRRQKMIHGAEEAKFLEFFADSPLGALFAEAIAIPEEELTDEILEPVKEGEEVVGEMSSLERRLKALFQKRIKEAASLQEQFIAALDDSSEQRDLVRRLSLADREMKVVADLMWFSILRRLPETAKTDSNGIRQGFKVVNFEESEICSYCGKRHLERGVPLVGIEAIKPVPRELYGALKALLSIRASIGRG